MAKKENKKPIGDAIEHKGSGTNSAKKEEMQAAAKTYWENKYEEKPKAELLYGTQHFVLMGAGLLLLVLGFFLMSGGAMKDENTWDPNVIYSFTRMTLAPILVLGGLGVVGYALFFNTAKDKETLRETVSSKVEEEA